MPEAPDPNVSFDPPDDQGPKTPSSYSVPAFDPPDDEGGKTPGGYSVPAETSFDPPDDPGGKTGGYGLS